MFNQTHPKKSAFTIAATALLLSTGAVSAQSFGYIGGTVSYGSAVNPNDNDESTSISPSIEGAYVFALGNGASIVVDAMARMDNYDPAMTDNEVSMPQYQANVSYLQPLSEKLIIGGFIGYGMAPFEDSNERYQVGTVGGSAVYMVSDATSIFAQAGYGTSFNPAAMNSSGFYNGYFIRAGAIYTGFEALTIRAEAEYAASEEYEDSSEPGEFWSVAIIGESDLAAVENLSITYGLRYASFNALNDPDFAQETTASLGVKYMFGGGTTEKFRNIGYLGTPYLPLRASFWTPEMD